VEIMAKNREITSEDASSSEVPCKTLFKRVEDYIIAADWCYASFEDKGYFSFGLRMRDGSVQVVVDATEEAGWSRILVYSQLPVFVPSHRRVAVSEALHRINYATITGNFIMDVKDGDVRAKAVLESDTFVSDQMIDWAIRRSLELAEQHFASILAVAFGNIPPDDILEMASRNGATPLQ